MAVVIWEGTAWVVGVIAIPAVAAALLADVKLRGNFTGTGEG